MRYQFDYFYGTEVEKFQFLKLPAFIVKDPRFSKVSGDAKILYGLMLDRATGLSMKNGWFDEKGRVYIIYTIKEIMEDFGCWQGKATGLLAELDDKTGIGLIERVRKGLGKANRIYVKDFASIDRNTAKNPHEIKNCENRNSENAKIANPELPESQFKSSDNQQLKNCAGAEDWNCEDSEVKSSAKAQSIQTDSIQTDVSQTEDNQTNLIYLPDMNEQMEPAPDLRVRELIRERIGYTSLLDEYKYHTEEIDEIVEIMVEAYTSTAPTLRIGRENKPRDVVLSRFDQIGQEHVEYVVDSLLSNTTKITKVKNYIMTALYNSTITFELHLGARVRHDLYGGD